MRYYLTPFPERYLVKKAIFFISGPLSKKIKLGEIYREGERNHLQGEIEELTQLLKEKVESLIKKGKLSITRRGIYDFKDIDQEDIIKQREKGELKLYTKDEVTGELVDVTEILETQREREIKEELEELREETYNLNLQYFFEENEEDYPEEEPEKPIQIKELEARIEELEVLLKEERNNPTTPYIIPSKYVKELEVKIDSFDDLYLITSLCRLNRLTHYSINPTKLALSSWEKIPAFKKSLEEVEEKTKVSFLTRFFKKSKIADYYPLNIVPSKPWEDWISRGKVW